MATTAKRRGTRACKAVRPSSLPSPFSSTPSPFTATAFPDPLVPMTTTSLPPTPSPSGSSNQDFPMEVSPTPSPSTSPPDPSSLAPLPSTPSQEGGGQLGGTELEASLDGLELEVAPPNPRKYNLRPSSVMTRICCELRRQSPRTPKPKSKPAPLSKYRRRAANSRERSRMEEMNVAFENLRQCLPLEEEEESGGGGGGGGGGAGGTGKATKITTLRTASSYIRALRSMLGLDSLCQTSSASSSSLSSSASPSQSSSSQDAGSPPHSSSCSAPSSGDEGSCLSPSLPSRSLGTLLMPAHAGGLPNTHPGAPAPPPLYPGSHLSPTSSSGPHPSLCSDLDLGQSLDAVGLGDTELDIPEGELLVPDDSALSCLPLPDVDLDSMKDLLP